MSASRTIRQIVCVSHWVTARYHPSLVLESLLQRAEAAGLQDVRLFRVLNGEAAAAHELRADGLQLLSSAGRLVLVGRLGGLPVDDGGHAVVADGGSGPEVQLGRQPILHHAWFRRLGGKQHRKLLFAAGADRAGVQQVVPRGHVHHRIGMHFRLEVRRVRRHTCVFVPHQVDHFGVAVRVLLQPRLDVVVSRLERKLLFGPVERGQRRSRVYFLAAIFLSIHDLPPDCRLY